jgi:AraC family transcriptional regulator of adaptative response / DNA-3-methyladenine glycosylase II
MNAAALDAEACYRASSGRDRRFDGQFVMAVRTTGIYCRPSCPARTPHRPNVEFFRTSAAAHLAGYRACKRCLPEAVPGSPEWSTREDTSARAMRLIADGVVDREGVPALAARLGYSTRQLTRLLTEELGAGPLALARAQRAQTARQLLVSTTMPASDVAFAAGFSSIRQFNDTVAEVFGMTPSAVRATSRVGERPGGRRAESATGAVTGAVTVRLAAREPFDGVGVLDWLRTRAIPGIEAVDDRSYTRSVRLAGGPGVVTVTPEQAAVRVTARLADLADLPSVLARVRRLFDLDADPATYDALLAADPRLAASVAATPGIRLPGALEPVEMVVRAILGQQVSVASARTAVRRLVSLLAEPLPDAPTSSAADASPDLSADGQPAAQVTHLFPTAVILAEAVRRVVTGPATRREALALACAAAASGELSLDAGATREALTRELEAILGIGPWTSNYVALRVLGSPDLLLTGDVAARTGAAALGLPRDAKPLAAAAAGFAPWRSYLMMHLWRAAAPAPTSPPGGVS